MNFEKSVLATLAYFDLFSQPLTREELFRYLRTTDNPDLRITYGEFVVELDRIMSLPGVVPLGTETGFYFLQGREEIVDERQRKVKIVEQKLKIAKRAIKKISWVPFLRAIFICNTVAGWTADEESDIDFFIIAKKGRIWLVRLLANFILRLFGLRTYGEKIKNRICLSFFVSDDNLNLESIALERDVYLMYWLAQLVSVYDPSGLHKSMLGANKWVGKFLQNFSCIMYHISCNNCDRVIGRVVKRIFEKMWGGGYGDLIETQAKGIQLSKLKKRFSEIGTEQNKNVIISDSMLKLHENDRREEYRERWKERCKNF